ncbi:nitroreductase family deazaflavin-dependent oxidoreductase [Pseudofrankia inefficax]|uniref:Nitroreductase family deazaflavin-dependent oxidoreductase n=1 Tax=Pseudofrankia inefficax (strain DSM 45817 / CECT 9037 / DDB 130130 / EuI1c) TaxID=298654 RepID=E3J8P4_PSEI1|nr:nitroreductase family deazaflavin-dependent oxidoreductase [Pseudofrankia inefficax]ADP78487.1 hypothetical protein FraEuI1c_0401 [Pseudofrankia inefficax]
MTQPDDYVPSLFPSVRDQVALYEATDGREGGTLEGRPVVILTHRGARSGKLRKTPVMRIELGPGYLVVASYGGAPNHPSWYHNLIANPLVLVRDGDTLRSMVAREAAGPEKAALWETADAAWPHFPEYRASTTREIPLLVLEPPG